MQLMQDAIPVGGSSGGIVFYKEGKEIFTRPGYESKSKKIFSSQKG